MQNGIDLSLNVWYHISSCHVSSERISSSWTAWFVTLHQLLDFPSVTHSSNINYNMKGRNSTVDVIDANENFLSYAPFYGINVRQPGQLSSQIILRFS